MRLTRSAARAAVGAGTLAVLLLVVPAPAEAAGLYEQVVVLQPGWNAVYLEIQPEPEDIEAAFAGVPVASVWTYSPDSGQVSFIQDPGEELLSTTGWWGFFPRPRPEAFLTNLFTLQSNRAYLIKLDGTQPVTWRVEGRPVLRRKAWTPDSFNLVGFNVDPAHPPTFGRYLAPSPAHDGQPIYRLEAGGAWTRVLQPYSETVRAGEAYWVYCSGPSDYQGPLEVSLDVGDSLEYSAALTSQFVTVTNNGQVDVDVTFSQRAASTPVPLAVEVANETTGASAWPDMPGVYDVELPAGEKMSLVVGVRRAALTADRAEHVMEISDGLGSRVLVTVGANTIQPGAAAAARPAGDGVRAARATTSTESFAGLWVGTANVDKVSNAQAGGTTLLPTAGPFHLRLIIHVDSGGRARLLKEVIQMWEDGTYAPSPDDPAFLTVETPGRHVLLTDDSLIANYTGVAQRDGVPVGLRVSTVDYDFADTELELNGGFGPPGALAATLVLESDFPTNPFKHRYHPDHDNLDAQFLNFRAEAYEVTREIELVFSDTDPLGLESPDWGDSTVGGTYTETITGVHRYPIFVGGTFRLQRISAIPVLNQ